MKIKVSEASGPVLDWMAAKCEGKSDDTTYQGGNLWYGRETSGFVVYRPSINWAQGGPIIDKMMRDGLRLSGYKCLPSDPTNCQAQLADTVAGGPTLLIAAMRCYVASKLGDTVEVPEELL